MKPDVQRIFNKLAKEKENNIEVNLEKVELARKPQSILKDIEKVDSAINKQKSKIDKAYLQYLKVWKEWDSFLQESDDKLTKLRYTDIKEVGKQLEDLGVKPSSVPDYSKASDIANKALNDIDGLKKMYKRPE
jgi:phosphoenolpyruvate-protein kinase (PTS system EI component)